MKTIFKSFLLLFVILNFTSINAQTKLWGTKFDIDFKSEIDLQLVLSDNYNYYLASVINVDGMMASHQVIIRKFDQKNQLVDTFIQKFPLPDMFTLHNYLGGYQSGDDKFVVFTQGYSNKTKKNQIDKIVFDKKSGTFTNTTIAEFDILSMSKSGTMYSMMSQNGNYIGIVYQKYNTKKDPEENECIVLDSKTLDVVWKKTISFPIESYSNDRIITNSGKFVFVRTVKEIGYNNVLAQVDANGIENKDFGVPLKLQKPTAISIGTQDYLVAFNYPAKGIRRGDFGSLMLYDLQLGKILQNNDVEGFNAIKDIADVVIRNVTIQNNEIHLFVDPKYKNGTKPDPTFPNSTFTVPVYFYGQSSLIVLGLDGKFKTKTSLNETGNVADIYNSFGLINYRGSYYLNLGNTSGFFKLNVPGFTREQKASINVVYEDNEFKYGNYINQFIHYYPDSSKLLLAKKYDDGKMVFVTYNDIKL